ncbi:MAG: zinc ribbon domain-containing protein [Verrucomicrobiae bacterium]|nr:zinc ribbon domain-containing protein [Verrucomicrobiae bacterium]
MTTYVYEIVPQNPGDAPRHVEIRQSMKDEPLTRHPETGEPIRRVVSGGLGLMGTRSAEPAPSSGHSCCRRSNCCG